MFFVSILKKKLNLVLSLVSINVAYLYILDLIDKVLAFPDLPPQVRKSADITATAIRMGMPIITPDKEQSKQVPTESMHKALNIY